jgi:protocatechuate 3,4-dioxygenase beta subunit
MASTAPQLMATTESIEGPYWKPNSPARTSLVEPDTKGERIVLSGRVTNTAGKPIAGAWLDFWQCDGAAFYDNKGFRLRGHQFTDEQGRYRVETVIPSEYDDLLVGPDGDSRKVYRTSHIHVKVKAPERRTITSQLFIPGAKGNVRDNYYTPECLLEIEETPAGNTGRFDFVVQ